MGHRLLPLLSIQVSPVPMKGVPELAGSRFEVAPNAGSGCRWEWPVPAPAWGIRQFPRVALWQLSESGRWPRRAEQFENAPLVCHPERDRLPSSPPSPAVAQSSGICRLSITSSPNHQKRRRARCYHLVEKCPTLRIKPSVGRCANRYHQNHRRNLHRGFSTRLFVGITASGSMFNVNRLGE